MMTFKVIIAGGRDFNPSAEHLERIERLLSNFYDVTMARPVGKGLEMVTGTAKGADQIPYHFNYFHGVPIKEFPADWDRYGKSAGYRRNVQMAEYADALIAFWDGKSKGTKHMIDIATERGLKLKVINY